MEATTLFSRPMGGSFVHEVNDSNKNTKSILDIVAKYFARIGEPKTAMMRDMQLVVQRPPGTAGRCQIPENVDSSPTQIKGSLLRSWIVRSTTLVMCWLALKITAYMLTR